MDWRKGLIELARRAIKSYLDGADLEIGEIPKEWLKKAATFVTLKIGGQLRGCIGNVQPYEELYRSVIRNAISAAFHDPRFPPLTRHEFPHVKISISILTEPKEAKGWKPEDLKGKGVILEKDGRSALFLPSVWEELPDPIEFLDRLCWKAGLPRGCWKSAKIMTFEAEEIRE